MSLFKVFDVAGQGMSAQMLRLNATASNISNANTVAGSEAEAYRARHPVFQTVLDATGEMHSAGVMVTEVAESTAEPEVMHQPDHPLADADGNVFMSNVSLPEEMANLISASRAYQTNVEVLSTSKELVLRTLALGR